MPYWASSDLEASLEQLLGHIAARWDIEVLFADCKELLGLDQYQLMSATAIERFWTLAMAGYLLLDEQRAILQANTSEHVTIGDAPREVQRVHRRHLLDWLHRQFLAGVPQEHLYDLMTYWRPDPSILNCPKIENCWFCCNNLGRHHI